TAGSPRSRLVLVLLLTRFWILKRFETSGCKRRLSKVNRFCEHAGASFGSSSGGVADDACESILGGMSDVGSGFKVKLAAFFDHNLEWTGGIAVCAEADKPVVVPVMKGPKCGAVGFRNSDVFQLLAGEEGETPFSDRRGKL